MAGSIEAIGENIPAVISCNKVGSGPPWKVQFKQVYLIASPSLNQRNPTQNVNDVSRG